MKLTRKRRLDNPSLGGLLATRQGAITLAVLCALAATGILIFAIGKYRHASTSSSVKQDTVLVATSEIQKGMPTEQIASRQLYKVTPILGSQIASGAIVNAAALAGKITASNILPGQQLTSADFTTGPVGVSTQLSPTERAVAVTLDAEHGASVLQAGERVDVYGSLASPYPVVVSLLVPDAVVLTAPAAAATGSSGGTVLLGVSMQLVPRVMWVADNGKVWLDLRGLSATNPDATVTDLREVLLGNHLANTPTYGTSLSRAAKR